MIKRDNGQASVVREYNIPLGAFCTHPRMRSVAIKASIKGRIHRVNCPDCGLEWQSSEGEHG